MEKAPINWVNMLLFSITPALAVTMVPLYGYYYGFEMYDWFVFIVLMAFCGISITAGYHRLWSHKAYKAHPILRIIFALGGACALQNDILNWASQHRRHHQYVDDNQRDPYSAGRGFWYSHIGWILRNYESGVMDFSNAKDLQRDPVVMWQHRNYLSLVLTTNIALPALVSMLGLAIQFRGIYMGLICPDDSGKYDAGWNTNEPTTTVLLYLYLGTGHGRDR